MYCNKCGNQFEGNFCDKCGAPVKSSGGVNAPVHQANTSSQASVHYSASVPAYPTGNVAVKKKSPQKAIITIAAVLVLAAGGVFVKIQIDNAEARQRIAEYEASEAAVEAAEETKLRTEYGAILGDWVLTSDDDIGQLSFSISNSEYFDASIEVVYDDYNGIHSCQCDIGKDTITFIEAKAENMDLGIMSNSTWDYEINGDMLILGGETFTRK
jgi:hypothetical protein